MLYPGAGHKHYMFINVNLFLLKQVVTIYIIIISLNIGLKFLGYSGKYQDLIWVDGTPVTFTSW